MKSELQGPQWAAIGPSEDGWVQRLAEWRARRRRHKTAENTFRWVYGVIIVGAVIAVMIANL